jgi:hypothetical protein
VPCSDITETITIKLDLHDRLTDYTFLKRTCGSNIGQKSLLLDQLQGKSVDEISALTQNALMNRIKPIDATEQFLIQKHLSVIQLCFDMLYGRKELDPRNVIKFYSINYGPDGMELEADIKLELDVKKIEPCHNP